MKQDKTLDLPIYEPETDEDPLIDSFKEMNIFKIIALLEPNKHLFRTYGATVLEPVEMDDGTWQIVFRGMHMETKEMSAVQVLFSKEDMKTLTEDEVCKMFFSAVMSIKAFKEEKRLIAPGTGDLIV